MTKDEFKEKFITSGLLTWDKVRDIDFDFMYNNCDFIDSTVAEIFEVPMVMVVNKRKELGVSIKKEEYGTFKNYKQQGRLKWEEVNYNRLDYLYNKCNFSDSLISELFDVPKRTVTNKRKELGITIFDNAFPSNNLNDVSSYLDFIFIDRLNG